MIARVAVHVRGEGARRNGADDDIVADEPDRHALGQVDQTRLARMIRVRLLRIDGDAVDRGDVDDLGKFFLARGGAQRAVQRLGEKERSLYIQVHDLVPAALGKLVELRTPGRTRIVDE